MASDRTEVEVVAYLHSATENANNLERQRQLVKRFCAESGLKEPIAFQDQATSGTRSDRVGLRDMINFCREHHGTILVIDHYQRLGRNPENFFKLLTCLKESDTTVLNASELNAWQPAELMRAVRALYDKPTGN